MLGLVVAGISYNTFVYLFIYYSLYGFGSKGDSGDGGDDPPPLPDEPIPENLLNELPVTTNDPEEVFA